jgi:hypothetical protein
LTSAKSRAWLLVAMAAILCLARLRTFDEPFERDITTYAVVGHELLDGRSLYTDLWDHKPPAVHVTYALAELVAGYGPGSVYLLNVAASIVTLLGVYAAGLWGSGSSVGGVLAAAFWTVLSGDLRMQGNQPNSEVFLNACLTWAFALLLRPVAVGSSRQDRIRRSVLAAACLLALASLYKHVAVAPAALVAAAHAAAPEAGSSRRRGVLDLIAIAAVGASAWALVFAFFAARGHLEAFYEAVFVFNRSMAGSLRGNVLDGLGELIAGGSPLLPVAPVAALLCAGLWLGRRGGASRRWLLLGAWITGAAIATWLPGKPLPAFFPHYYQLWIPPLVVGAGWSCAAFAASRGALVRKLGAVAAGLALLALLALELPSHRLSAEEWSRRKYGEVFIESRRLALRLKEILPGEYTFYNWGNEPGLYFYTKRSPPLGVLCVTCMLVQPVGGRLLERVTDGLARTRPHLIVLERSWDPPRSVNRWIVENYALVTRVPSRTGFEIWARR